MLSGAASAVWFRVHPSQPLPWCAGALEGWCPREKGGELLAARNLLYAARKWFLPALVANLLVETSSRCTFAAQLHRTNAPFSPFTPL